MEETKMAEKIYKNKLKTIKGSTNSGILALYFEDDTYIYIDNKKAIKALNEAFGPSKTPMELIEKIKGQTIYYTLQEVGLLKSFSPEDEASKDLLKEYSEQGDKNEKKQR